MPSSHLILCRPLLLRPPIPPSIRVFSNESTLPMRWPKYWSFNFSISPSNEHPGLISFRMDWSDLLAVQGALKSLLQHHSSKASIFRHSAFFTVQLSPIHDHWKNRSLDQMDLCWQSNVPAFNMLSSLVITFLPRSKHLLTSWLQSPSAVILETRKIKSATVSTVICLLEWSKPKTLATPKVHDVIKQEELIVDEKAKQTAWKTALQFLRKLNRPLTVIYSNCTPWHLPKGAENFCPHKNLHMNLHSCFIPNFPEQKATKMSFNR